VRVRLAVLGHPLAYTRSPELHRAGMAAIGVECESMALPTPPEALADRLRSLAADGFRGCNLTVPLKEPALALVGRASAAAARATSVNTIGFEGGTFPAGSWGDTTDGGGFLDWIAAMDRTIAGSRVLLLGAGGAARSLAAALVDGGVATLTVSVREPSRRAAGWEAMGLRATGGPVRFVTWRSAEENEAMHAAQWIVHATPLDDPEAILPPPSLPDAAAVVDLRYGADVTPWVAAARARGIDAWDGLGMLVHQARRSLGLWSGREIPLSALERAAGWPR
jgi:shikimate dehydrogenase